MNDFITADELTDALNQKRDIDLAAVGEVRVTYDALTRNFNVQGPGAVGISTPSQYDAADTFNRMVRAR